MTRRVSAQRVAVQALTQALDVPVSTQMPVRKPEEFVIISRIGDGDLIFGAYTPRFLVECYARSEVAAEELAEWVRYCWQRFEVVKPLGINSAQADANLVRYDAPDIDHFRFQFTGSLQILQGS